MKIRYSRKSEKEEILNVHKKAFGERKGPEIAELVAGLYNDETALPTLSLVAVEDKKITGHVLFTKVTLPQTDTTVNACILAPLAILPEYQKSGIGGKLIAEGLTELKKRGAQLVFVLGHPDYYPRSGFVPAGALGFEAPYPVAPEHAGAWMVQELSPGVLGSVKGKVQCSSVLDQPQHWRE